MNATSPRNTPSWLRIVALTGFFIAIWTSAGERVVHVKPTATGTGDGSSWTNATSDLQGAIDEGGGSQVWVAAGTYKPTGGTDRTISFQLKNGVAVYGGFDGTETELSARAPDTNTTILSGDIGTADTDADGDGVPDTPGGDSGDNSYHVIDNPTLDPNINGTAVLDGFTITAGLANGNPDYDEGGGIRNSHSSPTITDCIVSGNAAKTNGGGIVNTRSSSPALRNCTVSGNKADEHGGGIYNFAGDPTLTNCTVSNNTALLHGGGVYNYKPNLPLVNCVFSNNTASDGGGIYNYLCSPTLTNCTLTGNSISSSKGRGSAVYNRQSSPAFTNCIVWQNAPAPVLRPIFIFLAFEIHNDSSTPTFSHCIVKGSGGSGFWNTFVGTDLGGNLGIAPLFVDATNPDGADNVPRTDDDGLKLQKTSPAINAGTTAGAPAQDITGTDRLGMPDIGAYEFSVAPRRIALSYVKLDGDNKTGQFLNDLTFKSTGYPYEFRLGDFASRHPDAWRPLLAPNAKGVYTIPEVDIRAFMDLGGGDTSGYLYLNVRNQTYEKTVRVLVRTQKPSGSYYGLYSSEGAKNKLSFFTNVQLRTKADGNPSKILFTHIKGLLDDSRISPRVYTPLTYNAQTRYYSVFLDPLQNFWSDASRKYYMQLENELGLRSSIYTITVRTVRPIVSYAVLRNEDGRSNRLTDLGDGKVLLRLKASRDPVKYQLADTKDFSDRSEEHFFENETIQEDEDATGTYQYYSMTLPDSVAEYDDGVLWKYFYVRVAYLGQDPWRDSDNHIWSAVRRIKVYIKKPTVTYKALYNPPDGKKNRLTAYDNVHLRLKGTYNPTRYMLSDSPDFPPTRSQTFGGNLGEPDDKGYFDVALGELDNFQGRYSKSFYVKVQNPIGFWSRTYRFTVYAVRPYVLNAALVDDMRRSNILSTYYAQIRFRPRGNPVAYRLSDSDTFDGAITRQLITDGFDTSTDGADMEGSWLYKELPQPLDEYDLENGEFSRTYYLQMKNEDDVWSKTYRLNVKIDQPYISAAYLRNGDGRNNRITSLDHVTLELKSKELPIGFWLSDRRDFGHSRGTVLGPYKLRMMAPGVYQATVSLADFAGAASKKYYLKVLNSAGRESTVRTITVYAVRPKVTSVSPGKGQFVGGKIVVRGTGLNGGGRIVPNRWIRIGGIEVPTDDILSWTDTRIEFVVPEMDDRADNTLLEVKTQDFELPYQRVYKVFESPVGTWIMTATKPDGPLVSRKGEIVIFRHSDRYFLIEDEGVGELIATPDKGKLSGKVYYYDAELKGRQRPDLVLIPGVVFFESEIDYDGYDTVSLYLAETDDDTRVEDEMSGTWRESRVTANVTAERNDEVETVEDDTLPVYGCRLQASRRWPETYGDNRMETAWGSLAMLLLAERGADEVLLYTPPEAPRERHSVYVSPTPTGIWLEKNATLSKKFPFDVWHGKLSATLTDTQKTHVKLLIGDADEPMTLRLPPNPDDGPEDYESITCNHEDGGILDLSGRADVTFEYTLPDGMDPEDFYVNLEVFHDWKTADEIITETSDYDYDEGTNAITFTIDSDLFTAGRCYFAELEIVTLGIDGGAGASEESRDDPYVHLNGGKNYSYEFSLIASDDGQADDSYSVYYTRNGRFPDREVTWVRLANAVSGEQTVTLPDGAVGLRIRTHGRTEIASVSHPAEGDRPIVFLDFWNLDANWDAFWAAIVHTGNLEPGSSLDSGVLLLQNGTSIELSIRAEHAPGTHDVFRNIQGDITITPVVEFR